MTEPIKVIILSLLSIIIAQGLKLIISGIKSRKIDPTLLITTGNMPSSHSAAVTTLLTAIGLYDGFGYPFAIALVLALVVVHDSFGIRHQAGKHAILLNEMKHRLNMVENYQFEEKKLKESLGHKPLEVLVGVILGVVVALIGYSIL